MEFVETKVNVVTGPHLYYELGAFTIEGHFPREGSLDVNRQGGQWLKKIMTPKNT